MVENVKDKLEDTGDALKQGAKKAFVTDRQETAIKVFAAAAGIILGILVAHQMLADKGSLAETILPNVPVPQNAGFITSQ